jgi:OFA family oxalate/formate antiporter-like MFS transporter
LFLGLAVLVGLGIGLAYVCPLSTCVRWFPRHKGLITGIAVGGFGAGAILQAAVVTMLLERGMTALEIFRWIGITAGTAVVAGAWMLSTPAATESDHCRVALRLLELLRRRDFQIPALGVFTGTFAGLLVIGNLKPLGLSAGVSVASAAVAISTFSAGNASGRVVWGWLADRLGIRVIPLSLLFLAATVLSLVFIPEFPGAFWLMAAAVGFGFGACFVVYAAHVASYFGTERLASVYPAVFLFYGLSGVLGPYVGGALFDHTGSYLPAIATAVFVAGCGAWGCWKLIGSREEEHHPRHTAVSSRYATQTSMR